MLRGADPNNCTNTAISPLKAKTDTEIEAANRVLTAAFPLCNDRNLLAHGDWWHFDPTTGLIAVRGDREKDGQEQHWYFSAETLTEIAERLDGLEVELWHVKRSIERRASDGDE